MLFCGIDPTYYNTQGGNFSTHNENNRGYVTTKKIVQKIGYQTF